MPLLPSNTLFHDNMSLIMESMSIANQCTYDIPCS